MIGKFLTLVCVASFAQGEGSKPIAQPPAKEVEKLSTELDAVGWAFDALMKAQEEDRPYMRYVWIPPWADAEWIGAVDFAVNAACGQSTLLIRGERHAGGWLLGYNLRLLAPDPGQLSRLVSVWDELALRDPVFHLPRINVQKVVVVEKGKNVTREVSKSDAFLAPHLQDALARHIEDETKSQRIDLLVTQLSSSTGGIYRADFVIEQLLTSVRGKYPEFRQIDFAANEFTPFANLLKKRGFFLNASKDLRGDKGALLLTSQVTGKSRVVLTTFGLSSRQPLAVTFDYKDNRIRPDEQFIRNLVAFEAQADAGEALIPLPNGLIEYVLVNSEGQIQRVAPPDVVADSTKPDGHTKELEMGMSCVMCHFPDDGYKTAKNDIEFLLGSDTDFIGDDFSFTDHRGKKVSLTRQEALAIVVGRYGERIDEPDGILGRARRDFVRAVDQITDYQITDVKESPVQKLVLKMKDIYHGYRYRQIDAQRACLELGIRVTPEKARDTLRVLVPPPAMGEEEDIVIALLRAGAPIKRDDMDAIYGEMARRAVANRSQLFPEEEMK